MSTKKGEFKSLGKKKTPTAEAREKVQAEVVALTEELCQKHAFAEERADSLDSQIAVKKAEARAWATTNKRKALAAVKRVKALEKQQDQAWAIIGKLQALVDEIQQAIQNVDLVVAIKEQGKLIDAMFAANGLNQAEVGRIVDEHEDRRQAGQDILDVILAPGADELDDDQAYADLEALLDEEDPVPVQAQAVPNRPAAVAAASAGTI
jgi:charged multivesicular body protein 4